MVYKLCVCSEEFQGESVICSAREGISEYHYFGHKDKGSINKLFQTSATIRLTLTTAQTTEILNSWDTVHFHIKANTHFYTLHSTQCLLKQYTYIYIYVWYCDKVYHVTLVSRNTSRLHCSLYTFITLLLLTYGMFEQFIFLAWLDSIIFIVGRKWNDLTS